MKKRLFALLLIIGMLLALLPVTASAAANGAMDNIPAKFDVEIDLCGRTSDINIKDSKTYYIYSSSNDPEWVWTKKIQINGKKAAPHIFLDNVKIQVKEDAKTPAIELHGKASAYLYFIHRDSKLTGGGGRAAIQKNRSEGQLCVQVMKGTTVTCQGGYSGAGIGGSYAIRYLGTTYYNIDMYGHGVNMHFGSQTNPSLWSGTIIAKGGKYSAGIGGGRGGSGEKLYFYSGKIEATGGPMGAGIGGSFKGRGSDIYIYDGDISATGGEGAPGIGGGCWTEEQDMNSVNAARNINIYGGKIYACGSYNGAGIGGGQYVPAHDINITGGEIRAHGAYGAAIGGGRWCHGQNITVTDAKLTLTTGYNQYASDAAVMGYGDLVYSSKVYSTVLRYIGDFVRNPLPEDYKSIKIGSYHGKLIKLKVEARAINRDDEFTFFWNLYDILIPNERGLIDVQLLTLPYVKNYGWAINAMELELIDDPCNGRHDFGWVDRQSCHVWACRNMRCQARDPVAPESARNGKHASSGWNTEKHQLLCDVCGHVMETDTKAPVLEVLEDGKIYTAEDVRDEKTLEGKPGAYTFTVSDPAASGEASSGIKSVTINGKEQTVGATYSLPAPDGGNNDAGSEYTVVATDNAGNETKATVKVYRRHRVQVISLDESKTYVDKLLAHNEYLILTMKLPENAAVKLTDTDDNSTIPYENGEFRVGLIDRNRTFVLEYSTEYPQVELELGRNQRFTGYSADTDETYYLKDASKRNGSYSVGVRIDTTNATKPGCYFSSPNRYTQEQLAKLDEQGEIPWTEYKYPDPSDDPDVIIIYMPEAHIDAAEYDKNGSWYVYAKAENVKGTTYVSTPNLIADAEDPKAIDLSTGEELKSSGEYYGDLRFEVKEATPFTVWYRKTPDSTDYTVLLPDEDGYYTIPAVYEGSKRHSIYIEDTCGNKSYYSWLDVTWNYLIDVGEEGRYWETPTVQPLRISKTQNLEEELSKIKIVVKSAHSDGKWMLVDVDWEIPETYDPNSSREQTFTVNGTVILEGTKDNEKNLSKLDVVPCPGEERKKNISVQVTVEGDPQYKVQIGSSANGTVTVANAQQTDEDGRALFYEGEQVMLSVTPAEGYELDTLSVVGSNPVSCEGDDDTYFFTQPGENVTVYAGFKMLTAVKPTIEVTGEYVYNGEEQTANVLGYDARTMDITGHTGMDAGEYTVTVTPNAAFGTWSDGTSDPVSATWYIDQAEQDAPTGLIGVAPTTKDGSDGKITGTDDTMEYRAAGETVYTPCTGSEITGLSAGTYDVRYRASKNLKAGDDAKVLVGKSEPPQPTEFTVTFDANGGRGSMEPETVEEGTSYLLPVCAFTAPEGKEFDAWKIDGARYDVGDPYLINANTTATALWKDIDNNPGQLYSITILTSEGGSITASHTSAEADTQIFLTVAPNSGYLLEQCKAIEPRDLIVGPIDTNVYMFYMPESNVVLQPVFVKYQTTEFTVTFDGNGGTPTADSMQTTGQRLASLPGASRSEHSFDGWYTERNGGTRITTQTVFPGDTTVYAHWTYTGGSGSGGWYDSAYTIRASAGTGGSVTPSGNVSVRAGADQTFIITPDRGYAVSDVRIDGRSIGAVIRYTFENVRSSHTIEVSFRALGTFADVPSGSYYEDAVSWAAANGITAGTDAAHFSPDSVCTRAQAVTFLYRAAGSPAPKTSGMPFKDVPAGSYYYDAVLWAVENGITKGTGEAAFSPDETCTRAQIVSFLYRMIQSEGGGFTGAWMFRLPFTDAPDWAYEAIAWCYQKGITAGTTATTFSPNAPCTRAQIVTFLWRCKK